MVFRLGAALEALQRAPRRAARPPRAPQDNSRVLRDATHPRFKTPKMAPRRPNRPTRSVPRGKNRPIP
eukprot:6301036-Pyramimonas_sp.AAC.1